MKYWKKLEIQQGEPLPVDAEVEFPMVFVKRTKKLHTERRPARARRLFPYADRISGRRAVFLTRRAMGFQSVLRQKKAMTCKGSQVAVNRG